MCVVRYERDGNFIVCIVYDKYIAMNSKSVRPLVDLLLHIDTVKTCLLYAHI